MAFLVSTPSARPQTGIRIGKNAKCPSSTPRYRSRSYSAPQTTTLSRRIPVTCAATEPKEYSQADEDEFFATELTEEELALCEETASSPPSLNCIVLTGRLGADPEHKVVGDDLEVCRFPLAVNDEWDPDEDSDEDKTSWFDIEAWGSTARFVKRTARKGLRVGISGTLGMNSWTGRDGEEREQPVVTAATFEVLQSRGEATYDNSSTEFGSNSGQSYRKKARDISLMERKNLEDLPF